MIVKCFDIDNTPIIDEKINLCLGFFDGIHKGHLKLINKAKEYHQKVGILSFESSPKTLENNRLITPLNEKIKIFEKLGCDYLLLLKVDEKLIKTDPNLFINVCLKNININHLICGDDFTFGYQGKGKPDDLKKYFKVDSISLLENDGRKISSRDIKTMIENGQIEIANELMSREYQISGLSQKGFGKGRKLGFNTLNVVISDEYVIPKYGVYLTNNFVNGKWYYGLTNLGIHPTLNKLDEPIIESHLLDYDKYVEIKDEVNVKFIKFIREEKCFNCVKELQDQVLGDIERIKEYLGNK